MAMQGHDFHDEPLAVDLMHRKEISEWAEEEVLEQTICVVEDVIIPPYIPKYFEDVHYYVVGPPRRRKRSK